MLSLCCDVVGLLSKLNDLPLQDQCLYDKPFDLIVQTVGVVTKEAETCCRDGREYAKLARQKIQIIDPEIKSEKAGDAKAPDVSCAFTPLIKLTEFRVD